VRPASASARFGRGLRRIVDALQRGLFDEPPVDGPPIDGPSAGERSVVVAPPSADPAGVAGAPFAHPQATRELVLDGRRVAFRLVRIRRRSIGFVVDARGLTVRAPKWIALREIDAGVREKQAWILGRFAEQRERAARSAATGSRWHEGARVDYLGQPMTIVLDAQPGAPLSEPISASPRRLRLGLPRDASEARIRDAVQSWLQREAERVFAERVAHFAARLGVRVTRLSLSSAATRWGSANANGAVRLHWRLIQHPPATIDYVVAHELAHLREMNHSARFWKVVESVVPDYRSERARLRSEGRLES
jgi:predicted metal-dependent hydrolase